MSEQQQHEEEEEEEEGLVEGVVKSETAAALIAWEPRLSNLAK